LLAVAAVVTAVAALRLRVAGRLAFEVGRRDVVEQQVVLDAEQRAGAVAQVLLDRFLVHEHAIEGAVEAIVVDLVLGDPQQIIERRLPVESLRDAQIAGRHAEGQIT
jgi:hypothetical protein